MRRGRKTPNRSLNLVSKLSHARPNPPSVKTDLITRKTVEVVLTATASPFFISPSTLIDTIRGGSNVWDKMQVHRIDVYGDDVDLLSPTGNNPYPSISATLTNMPTAGWFSDQPTYYSDPVGTAKRAHVGIVPNALYRNMWISTTSSENMVTITSGSSRGTAANPGFRVIMQFTLVLRSLSTQVQGEPVAALVMDGRSAIEHGFTLHQSE